MDRLDSYHGFQRKQIPSIQSYSRIRIKIHSYCVCTSTEVRLAFFVFFSGTIEIKIIVVENPSVPILVSTRYGLDTPMEPIILIFREPRLPKSLRCLSKFCGHETQGWPLEAYSKRSSCSAQSLF